MGKLLMLRVGARPPEWARSFMSKGMIERAFVFCGHDWVTFMFRAVRFYVWCLEQEKLGNTIESISADRQKAVRVYAIIKD